VARVGEAEVAAVAEEAAAAVAEAVAEAAEEADKGAPRWAGAEHKNLRAVHPDLAVGFGRIVISERDVPILFANLV
jgi:hypothetical protein